MGDDQHSQALRIFAWMVPRVNSTVLAKCMTFVDDTLVWMEPYFTCHFNDTYYNPEWRKGDPLAERQRERTKMVMSQQTNMKLNNDVKEKATKCPNLSSQGNFTQEWLKKQLEAPEPGKKFIFIKDQSVAIINHLDCLPENVPTRHIFLIRHPREMYTSWKKLITCWEDPHNPIPWEKCHAADDAYHMPVPEFYQIHHKLWKHVKEHLDSDPIIVDSYDLTSNPYAVLPKLFEKLHIPYKRSYLEWTSNPEVVFSSWRGSPDIVIGQAFFPATSRAVHSTKFEPPRNPRGVPNPEWKITDELQEYIEAAMPFYEEMYSNRLS